MAVLVMFVFSCRQDERRSSESSLTAVTEGDILSPWQGGEYSFEYTLRNPPEGGTLCVSVPDTATWITDIDWSKDGVVKFNIAANYREIQYRCQLCLFAAVYRHDHILLNDGSLFQCCTGGVRNVLF